MPVDATGLGRAYSDRQQMLICCLVSGITDARRILDLTGYTPQQLVDSLRKSNIRRMATTDPFCLVNVVSAAVMIPQRCSTCGQMCVTIPCVACQASGVHQFKKLLSNLQYGAVLQHAIKLSRSRKYVAKYSGKSNRGVAGKPRKNRSFVRAIREGRGVMAPAGREVDATA